MFNIFIHVKQVHVRTVSNIVVNCQYRVETSSEKATKMCVLYSICAIEYLLWIEKCGQVRVVEEAKSVLCKLVFTLQHV